MNEPTSLGFLVRLPYGGTRGVDVLGLGGDSSGTEIVRRSETGAMRHIRKCTGNDSDFVKCQCASVR